MRNLFFAFLFGCVLISTCGQQDVDVSEFKVSNESFLINLIPNNERFAIYNDGRVILEKTDSALYITDSLVAIQMLLSEYLKTTDEYMNFQKRLDTLKGYYLDYRNRKIDNLNW